MLSHSIFIDVSESYLASNYLDCVVGVNYSALATLTDWRTFSVQCGSDSILFPFNSLLHHVSLIDHPCPLDFSSPNVTFQSSTSYSVNGTCSPFFSGNPTKKCLLSGIEREWDQTIEGSCQRQPPFPSSGSVIILFIYLFMNFVANGIPGRPLFYVTYMFSRWSLLALAIVCNMIFLRDNFGYDQFGMVTSLVAAIVGFALQLPCIFGADHISPLQCDPDVSFP